MQVQHTPNINDINLPSAPTNGMTIVVVILIGTGALLLISAIENTSLLQTFQGIISGKPITQANSSGDNKQTSTDTGNVVPPVPGTQKQPAKCKGNPNAVIPWAPPFAMPDKNGCCPDGYSLVSGGVFAGQLNYCQNNYNVNVP